MVRENEKRVRPVAMPAQSARFLSPFAQPDEPYALPSAPSCSRLRGGWKNTIAAQVGASASNAMIFARRISVGPFPARKLLPLGAHCELRRRLLFAVSRLFER